MKRLRQKIIGYYRYYGITGNIYSLSKFTYLLRRLTFKWLNRRSQRRSYNWVKFDKLFERYRIPHPKIYVNIFELRPHINYTL